MSWSMRGTSSRMDSPAAPFAASLAASAPSLRDAHLQRRSHVPHGLPTELSNQSGQWRGQGQSLSTATAGTAAAAAAPATAAVRELSIALLHALDDHEENFVQRLRQGGPRVVTVEAEHLAATLHRLQGALAATASTLGLPAVATSSGSSAMARDTQQALQALNQRHLQVREQLRAANQRVTILERDNGLAKLAAVAKRRKAQQQATMFYRWKFAQAEESFRKQLTVIREGATADQQQTVASFLSETRREMRLRESRENQLESRMKVTSGVVEQLRLRVAAHKQTELGLREALKRQEESANRLSSALTLLEDKRQELMIANATLQAEAERSKLTKAQELSQARAQLRQLSADMESVERERDQAAEARAELEFFKQRNDDLLKSIEKLKADSHINTQRLSEKQHAEVSASRKIADLNAELREANAARDSAEKRQRVSAGVAQSLQQEVSNLQKQMSTQKDALLEARSEVARERDRADLLQARVEAKLEAETELLRSGAKLRQDSARKDRQRHNLAEKVVEYESELRAAVDAQAAAIDTAQQLGTQLSEAKEKLATTEQALASKAGLEQAREAAEQAQAAVAAELRDARQQLLAARRELIGHKVQKDLASREAMRQSAQEVKSKQEARDELVADMQTLEKENAELRAALDALRSNPHSSKDDLLQQRQLVSDKEAVCRENEDLKTNLASVTEVVNEAKAKILELETELDHQKSRSQQLSSELHGREDESARLERHLVEAKWHPQGLLEARLEQERSVTELADLENRLAESEQARLKLAAVLLKVLERGRDAQDKLAEQREQESSWDFHAHNLPTEQGNDIHTASETHVRESLDSSRFSIRAAEIDGPGSAPPRTKPVVGNGHAPKSSASAAQPSITLPVKVSPMGGELASPGRPPMLQADADETFEFGELSQVGGAGVGNR